MPTVTNTEKDPVGNPHKNAVVRVRLVAALVGAAPGYVPASDYSIAGEFTTRTDAAGVWTISLVSNELISPANTYYVADVQPKVGQAIRHEFAVPNGAGPYRVEDILTDPPANLPDLHSLDPIGAHVAGAIAVTPAGNLSATDSQAAFVELDAHDTAEAAARAAGDALAAQRSANLSDLANAATARTNLGLGTAATQAIAAFDPAGAAAAAQAASQPVDADLTAIAALSTTAFGRSLLALADAAAGRTALALGTAATQNVGAFDPAGAAAAAQAASQPVDSDLTAIAALSTTAYGRAFLALADAAAGRTALGAADDNAVIKLTGDQTKTSGTTQFDGPVRHRHVETRFDVTAYSPGFGSVADTLATIQAAAAAWSAAGGGELNFPAGRDFTVNGRVPMPTTAAGDFSRYTVQGNGCKLRAAAGYAGVVFGHAMPVDEASIIRNQFIAVDGLDLRGSNEDTLRQQVLLRVVGGQNVLVRRCGFKYADVGLDLVACLNAEVEHNESKFCYSYPYLIRPAVDVPLVGGATLAGVPAATVSGSAPNVTRLAKNRDFAYIGTLAQFGCYGGDGFILEGNTGEGFNPVNNVLWDSLGHTSGRVFTLFGHHFENSPTNALVKLWPYTGHCIIDATWPNSPSSVFVDTANNPYGSATTSVVFVRVGTLLVSPSFKTTVNGPRYRFNSSGASGSVDFTAASHWVGGVTPESLGIDRFADATLETELGGFGFGLAGSRVFLHASGQVLIKSDQAIDGNKAIILAGRVVQKVAGSAVPGVYLDPNMIALDTDEATNEIVITWVKNGGSTRTARIATS